ncbi:Cytochrome c biogenesis protein CcsA [Poriferisphaera corsica]|uniref:Cytochrome c biogenesis protein CcsA n=1 Tax=Poriferisphaera corsica TaxID=2528020 RepID=A0A517YTZ4_9BACT|nr:cytochrome c biogenesis protein CcsA [Poriferisphaera corsica]QDU33703.1 Cytochrome c biogenesis protein CcsA [Poriferisphaera corsica]
MTESITDHYTNHITSILLVILTLMSIAAWLIALRRFRHQPDTGSESERIFLERSIRSQNVLVLFTAIVSTILFVYRWIASDHTWQPLVSHVDGLLLIASLFSYIILYFQNRPNLRAIATFALPLLALLLCWGICASAWSYKQFNTSQLDTIWFTIHLFGVYLGTLFAAIAAITGAMYLFIQYRLKDKSPTTLKSLGRFTSLETLERIIIRAARIGFALFTIGLITGLVIITTRLADLQADGATLWLIPKILLALIAWALYAIIMNVRYATLFRGSRAAWLSILGLVLLLAVYGIVNIMPEHDASKTSSNLPTHTSQNATHASEGGE